MLYWRNVDDGDPESCTDGPSGNGPGGSEIINLSNKNAEFYIPDGRSEAEALKRTTHLGIGAHHDDLEIMAYHGILSCYRSDDTWFLGVTVSDGAGSPRTGPYEHTTDEEMQHIRRDEQKRAAAIGEYSGAILLNHPSKDIKNPADTKIVLDLKEILTRAKPDVVYTHNLADKHDTHVGVSLKAIAAMRALSDDAKPKRVYGCEVWRSLDWLLDTEKTVLDVSGQENLAAALLGVYDSQIAGGKRYDLASLGRWRANATYYAAHATDQSTALSYAMDLTPLIKDPALDIAEYVAGYISRLARDVSERIKKFSAS